MHTLLVLFALLISVKGAFAAEKYKFDFKEGLENSINVTSESECVMSMGQKSLELLKLDKNFKLSRKYSWRATQPLAATKYWIYLVDRTSQDETEFSLNLRISLSSEFKDADGNRFRTCHLSYGDTYDMIYLFDDVSDKTIIKVSFFDKTIKTYIRYSVMDPEKFKMLRE